MQSVGRIAFIWNDEVKDWKESNFSKAIRITFLAIAAIISTVGLLTMSQVPGLSQIGTLGGGGIFALSYIISVPFFIKYVKPPCSFSTESSVLRLTSLVQRNGNIAKKDQLSNLPQEIQLRICQLLSKDDLSQLSRVSVHFHKLSKDRTLWNPPDHLPRSYPFYLENGVIKKRGENRTLYQHGKRFIDLDKQGKKLYAFSDDGGLFCFDLSTGEMIEILTNLTTKEHRFSAKLNFAKLKETRIYAHNDYVVLIYSSSKTSAFNSKETLLEVIPLCPSFKSRIFSQSSSSYVSQVFIHRDKLFSLFPGEVRIDNLKTNSTRYISIGQPFAYEYYPELVDTKVVRKKLYTLSSDGIIYIHSLVNGREKNRYHIPLLTEKCFEGIAVIHNLLFVYCKHEKEPVYAIDLENESIVPYEKISKRSVS